LVENSNGDNVTVPIVAGAKVTGRESAYNIGILDIETGSLHDASLAGGLLDRRNLLALRLSRNLFEQSWIGGIITHGNPMGAGASTLVGADARFATSRFRGNKNLTLDLFVLRTSDQATASRGGAGGFRLDYPNDRWDVSLNWKQIGDTFQPALGFVPRAGIGKTNLGIAFQPRPERWGIRQFFFELRPEYITNLQNRAENWRLFTAPFNVRTESGEHLEWNVVPEFEHLDAPFEISPGVVIPPGSYRWTRYRVEANTATKRRWVVDVAGWYGGFYDGTRRQLEGGLTVKPNTHVSVAVRFVPPAPIQEVRDLTRTRKQLVREIAQHTQRIQKTLDIANLKITGLVSNVLGVSGRAILRALIAGQTDPIQLADLARGTLKNKRAALVEALTGRVTPHQRRLLKLHLDLIERLEAAVADVDAQLGEALALLVRPWSASMESPASIRSSPRRSSAKSAWTCRVSPRIST
jgi:hypothetical protein